MIFGFKDFQVYAFQQITTIDIQEQSSKSPANQEALSHNFVTQSKVVIANRFKNS